MELKELQKHWNAFGKEDPLWAIVSLPEMQYGKWDVPAFFRDGKGQVDGLLFELERRGIALPSGKALDFGCGVGRLTQALAAHFEECCGVDIAPAMVETARRYNQFGDRCRYFLNERDDLSLFGDEEFQFILSFIVLQHMRPEYIRSYLKEFLRILAPGGVAVFQLPAGLAPVVPPAFEGSDDSSFGPLPAEAFRAEVIPVDPPARLHAGVPAELKVRIRNLGDTTWPAQGGRDGRFWVKLGNHWLDPAGNPVVFDDGRTLLPFDVEPGATVELSLRVKPPTLPDRYLLEVDMVQEAVAWFKARGSAAATVALEVVAAPPVPAPAPRADSFVPRMEMHWIPRAEVVGLLTRLGGKVLDVQRVNEDGALLDYNYYLTK